MSGPCAAFLAARLTDRNWSRKLASDRPIRSQSLCASRRRNGPGAAFRPEGSRAGRGQVSAPTRVQTALAGAVSARCSPERSSLSLLPTPNPYSRASSA